MKKILIIVLVLVLAACNRPTRTPDVRPTLTSSPTSSPTATQSPTATKTVAPTVTTIVPTILPTKTPVPTPVVMVRARTGYEPGWLFYRRGPGMFSFPNWAAVGVVQEGTEMEFLGCDYAPYPWAHVRYMGVEGWVYSPFTEPDLCSR